LSTDSKILEVNHEAEKFFGKKRKEAINQSFIQMFIPEELRNKTDNNLNRQLKKASDGKLKMQVIAAGGKMRADLWSAYIIHNTMNTAEEIVLALKKQPQHE
jgi:PAS domain S-box-containing protein